MNKLLHKKYEIDKSWTYSVSIHPKLVFAAFTGKIFFEFACFARILDFDHCWPHMTFDLHQNYKEPTRNLALIKEHQPPNYVIHLHCSC